MNACDESVQQRRFKLNGDGAKPIFGMLAIPEHACFSVLGDDSRRTLRSSTIWQHEKFKLLGGGIR